MADGERVQRCRQPKRPWSVRAEHPRGTVHRTSFQRGADATADARSYAEAGWVATVTHRPSGRTYHLGSRKASDGS